MYMYTSGQHHWESGVTFSVVHVSMTVPSLVLFYFTNFSTHPSQHSSSTAAETVETVGQDIPFFNSELISQSCETGRVGTLSSTGYPSRDSHITFPTVFVHSWYMSGSIYSPPFIYS